MEFQTNDTQELQFPLSPLPPPPRIYGQMKLQINDILNSDIYPPEFSRSRWKARHTYTNEVGWFMSYTYHIHLHHVNSIVQTRRHFFLDICFRNMISAQWCIVSVVHSRRWDSASRCSIQWFLISFYLNNLKGDPLEMLLKYYLSWIWENFVLC